MEEIKLASVKFKSAGKIYYFSTNLKLKKDDRVVVETARGLELGEISQELKDISEFNLDTELKKIVRKATKKDIENYQKNVKDAKQALVTCKEIVSRYDVNMQLTNCEYTLDKAKVIFMYTSDDRVDFRELLKELAVVFKCRIELRQIGPRDKAKVIGGIGTCGLPLCCSTLLGEFNGVSINMAKNQMLAINIEKISGACGRLMCCLKYEDEIYSLEKERFPKIGSRVKYQDKDVKVTGLNVINDLVKIETNNGIVFVGLDEIKFDKIIMQERKMENQEVINYLLAHNDLKIIQRKDMFNFSLDTVLLSQFCTINKDVKNIVDFGTNNAAIPLLLSKRTPKKIIGIEIQDEAVDLARRNVEMNDLNDQIEVVHGDIKDVIKELPKAQLIVCNPPFFKVGENSNLNDNEYLTIARHEIKIDLEGIISAAAYLLDNKGRFAIVHRPDRMIDILNIMQKYDVEPKRIRFVYPKMNRDSHVLLVEGMYKGKKGLKIEPPLYAHNDDGSYSNEVRRMFGEKIDE